MKNKKFILASIFVIGFFIPVFIVQAQASDHLLITQAQITGGPGKTANDFVEIHNPTNNDIDLKGYRLVKRTKTATTPSADTRWGRSPAKWKANRRWCASSTAPSATTRTGRGTSSCSRFPGAANVTSRAAGLRRRRLRRRSRKAVPCGVAQASGGRYNGARRKAACRAGCGGRRLRRSWRP